MISMMQRGQTDKDRRRNATNESHALRDLASKLKIELLQSQVETQKVKDQLQCMIYLVRRAWQGDEVASIHVANIVGVAPPKMQRSDQDEVMATPKSRALNGWARLVIGVLNRMYHEEELELRAKQFLYMRDREELLDEQLISHKNITHHQTNVSLLQTSTLQLLQAKEECKAREIAGEREKIEQQKQELKAKFRGRPSKLQTRGVARKERVERVVDLDVSGNLLISPVRNKKMAAEESTGRHVNSPEDEEDETIVEGSSSFSSHIKKESENSNDVFLTRRRSNSLSREEAALPKQKRSGNHTRSQTSEGTGKRKPRPQTAAVKSSNTEGSMVVKSKRRPLSAHVTHPMPWSKPPPTFDTSKTRRQLDLIERDLKFTTKALQDRLGISKQGFV